MNAQPQPTGLAQSSGRQALGGIQESFDLVDMAIGEAKIRPLVRNRNMMGGRAPMGQMGDNSVSGYADAGKRDIRSVSGRKGQSGLGDESQVIEMLKPIFEKRIDKDTRQLMDPKQDIITAYIGTIESMPDNVTVDIFNDIGSQASLQQLCGQILMYSPIGFAVLVELLTRCINLFGRDTATYQAAFELLKKIGSMMVSMDPAMTDTLFRDLLLKQLIQLAARNVEKRESISAIIHAFNISGNHTSTTQSHMFRIRYLKLLCPEFDLECYIHLLSYFAAIDGSQLHRLYDETLLDVYVYYAHIGLESHNPRIQTHAVSILSTIAQEALTAICWNELGGAMNPLKLTTIFELIPRLSPLSKSQWWEVKAQVLILSCLLLQLLEKERARVDKSAQLNALEMFDQWEKSLWDLVNVIYVPLTFLNLFYFIL